MDQIPLHKLEEGCSAAKAGSSPCRGIWKTCILGILVCLLVVMSAAALAMSLVALRASGAWGERNAPIQTISQQAERMEEELHQVKLSCIAAFSRLESFKILSLLPQVEMMLGEEGAMQEHIHGHYLPGEETSSENVEDLERRRRSAAGHYFQLALIFFTREGITMCIFMAVAFFS